MRALIQRVARANVSTTDGLESSVERGLLIFLGVENNDTQDDAVWLAGKIVSLRVFNDDKGVMNRSVIEIGGQIMVISQFTLQARIKKGNRPSYVDAAPPEISVPLYQFFIKQLELNSEKEIATGVFGASMQVELVNDGPVTIWMDSKQKH